MPQSADGTGKWDWYSLPQSADGTGKWICCSWTFFNAVFLG
jgi:hypothetical protein